MKDLRSEVAWGHGLEPAVKAGYTEKQWQLQILEGKNLAKNRG
jgi:hypothetical protein